MWSRWTSAMAERQRSPTWWQAGSSRLTLWLSRGPHAVLPDVPRGDPRSVASSPPGGGRGPLSKVAPFTEKETEAQRGDATPLMSHSKYMRPGMGTWDPSALLPGLRPPHGPGTPCWPGTSVGSLRRIPQKDVLSSPLGPWDTGTGPAGDTRLRGVPTERGSSAPSRLLPGAPEAALGVLGGHRLVPGKWSPRAGQVPLALSRQQTVMLPAWGPAAADPRRPRRGRSRTSASLGTREFQVL